MLEPRLPLLGARCPRCHRTAPRTDGIPCGLCAPAGANGITFTDKLGITHYWLPMCDSEPNHINLNVGDVPVTCMACIATGGELSW